MNAKPFEERTVFKILTPARIERIGRAFDLRMSPYLGFSCTAQFQPKDLTARCFGTGINRKHPTSLSDGMPILAHDPSAWLVRMSAFGPAPETLPQQVVHLCERVRGHN